MSTKIKLEAPFSNDYKTGYLNINKEPRRVVLLIREDGSRTSVSYARYLMSCELKRYLNKNEHVDHKDDNRMNDHIKNFQLLTPKENNEKKNLKLGIVLAKEILLICPICSIEFSRPSRNIKHKLLSGKTPCCSRACGGVRPNKKQKKRPCIASGS